jgi:glycosyltransferase involved in cell wall biosynthesis
MSIHGEQQYFMTIPRVSVLLSSYNGARYIEDQVNSILSQRDVGITLYIRDDGSSDATVAIVSRLASLNSNIIFDVGDNIGFISSFFNLLARSDDDAHYYAFADQDDFWLPEKLITGVMRLEARGGGAPAMYCSRTEYVNESLEHLSYSTEYEQEDIGFGNSLVQNIATGCTIVINANAKKLVLTELPLICVVHDWWIYLVVSAFGVVVYDPVSHIKYRQHAGNVIGASSSFVKNTIKRTRRFFSSAHQNRTSLQIAEFKRIFHARLTPSQFRDVSHMLAADRGIWNRFSLVCRRFYWRQNIVDSILLRIMILMGRF